MWRTCSLAISLSLRSGVEPPRAAGRATSCAVSCAVLRPEPDEDVRLLRVGIAVVELGDVARAEQRAELAEAAGCSGIVTASIASRCSPSSARSATKRRRSKFMLAPQATATSVRSLHAVPLAPGLDAGDRQRAGRLEDRARVLEHVLDRRADRVGVDQDHVVDELAARCRNVSSPTCLTATPSANRPTWASFTRRPAASERAIASESTGSTPMMLISGRRRLTYAAMPAIRPPPPIGDEDRVERPLVLAQDLHADGALAGDHVRIVVRDARRSRRSRSAAPARARRRRRRSRRAARPRRRAPRPRRP